MKSKLAPVIKSCHFKCPHRTIWGVCLHLPVSLGVAAPYVCCFIGIGGHGSRITMMEAPQQWQLLDSLIFSCRPRTTSLQECESWCQRGQHIIAQPNKNGLAGHAFKNYHNQPSWKAQDSSKWPRRAANPASRPVLLNLDFLIDSNQEFKIISVRWRKEWLGLSQKTFVKTDLTKETGDVQKLSLGAMYSSALWSQVPGSSSPYSTPVPEKTLVQIATYLFWVK